MTFFRPFFSLILFSLIIGGPASSETFSSPDLKAEFLKMSRFMRPSAQESLAKGGFYRGKADGLWGPATEAAYRQVQGTDLFRAAAPEAGFSSRLEQLIFFPFSLDYAESYLDIPVFRDGDSCDTCDFGEGD